MKRTLFCVSISALLLLVMASSPVQADVIGTTYSFSAVWLERTYQADSVIVQQELYQGTFQISVTNITPNDAYEYVFTGMNSNYGDDTPYYDEQNETIGFDDNTLAFDLHTTDADDNGLAEAASISMYPFYHHSNPGQIIFVDSVWVTHNTDWAASVAAAESEDGFQTITESADKGTFSFHIIVDIEQDHSDYGNMTGTASLTFSASYDADGVLLNRDFSQVNSLQNENHTITDTISTSFTRGTGSGAGFVGSSELMSQVTIAGVAVVVGLVLGVVIAKRYYG